MTGSEAARSAVAREQGPFTYFAYGLRIESDFRLDELEVAAPGAPDVVVRRRSLGFEPAPHNIRQFDFEREEYLFHYTLLGVIRIRGTDVIEVDPFPEAEPLVSHALLGPVFAMLLHLRGALVLHASAVSVGGRGVAFLGQRRAGKSTLAAALLAVGHRLISDDVVAVTFRESGYPTVAPAFARIKLADDSSGSIGLDAQAIERAHPKMLKRQHRVGSLCSGHVEMRHLFLLSRGEPAGIARLAPGEALTQLISHAYIRQFGREALSRATATVIMRQAARALANIPISRLTLPGDLARLEEASALLEVHV